MDGTRSVAADTARLGLLFALAVCLSLVESLVPSPGPVPGIKLGLSNLVTMYALLDLGARRGAMIAVLKSLFVLLTRGAVASLLSLAGGLLSVTLMALCLRFSGRRASYGAVSMVGAVAHNIGQLAAASAILGLGAVLWYYLPFLVASGVVMGLLTSTLLRAVLPLLRRRPGGG